MRKQWTSLEVRQLNNRYSREGAASLALELGRSVHSVNSFARRCGLRKSRDQYRARTEKRQGSTSNDQLTWT